MGQEADRGARSDIGAHQEANCGEGGSECGEAGLEVGRVEGNDGCSVGVADSPLVARLATGGDVCEDYLVGWLAAVSGVCMNRPTAACA